MKPDLYTRIVLTVIALALVLIACNQYVHPASTVAAQGQFAGLTFTVDRGGPVFFDTRTGEVWSYYSPTSMKGATLEYKVRLEKLGQPLK